MKGVRSVRGWKRLLLLAVLGLGIVLWRTGFFGFWPTERVVIYRFPVSYAEVTKLELQLWEGDELLKREERSFSSGLQNEPSLKVPLSAGMHRAIASVWLRSETSALSFQRDFEPGSGETVVLEMKR